MLESAKNSYRDIMQYPESYLKIEPDIIRIPVTYNKTWDDGFGARGWKLDVTIGDEQIIASTRETGRRINTSVFVHDILDHFLSGFGVSGHRSEAMALIQLAKRTGSSPEPDYTQIIEEDILHGRVNGESMRSFLPAGLTDLLPDRTSMTDKETIAYLRNSVGKEQLRDTLIRHFFALGKSGEAHALTSLRKLGLAPHRQEALGISLQALLVEIDSKAESMELDEARGVIVIARQSVSFEQPDDGQTRQIGIHRVAFTS